MPQMFAPMGFRPISNKTSGHSHNLGQYSIASGYGSTIAQGDLVKSDGNGGIVKAGPGDAILGVFHGYNIDRTNQGSLTDLIPFYKIWAAGTVTPANSRTVAVVAHDPFELFEVTCVSATNANIGAFVDMVDGVPEPIFGHSRQMVTPEVQGSGITAVAVGGGGTNYSSQTRLLINGSYNGGGAILVPTIVSGVITAVAVSGGGAGFTAAPTITAVDPAGTGSGATFTATIGALAAPSQFRVERIIERATRITNAAGNETTGYGLTGDGTFAVLEVAPVKHERGGVSMAIAV